jgi:hypothetical protein
MLHAHRGELLASKQARKAAVPEEVARSENAERVPSGLYSAAELGP